jgi:hypothetical protein
MSEPAKRYYKTFSDNMHLQSENARLKAEVERLTKAGDDLITALDKRDDVFDNSDKDNAINAWNAAKEGKKS